VLVVFLGVAATRLAQNGVRPEGRHGRTGPATSARIVSLAPSVTEIVFALQSERKLVGVTRYCEYPPEAKLIAQVGGYLDPSFEAIVRLKPDLVIITSGNNDHAKRLGDLGIEVLTVDHNTIAGIVGSVGVIGSRLGAGSRAKEVTDDIGRRIEAVRARTRGLERPKVLLCVGRSIGSGSGEIYVAGRRNFYDEMIEIAGGVNAFDSMTPATPSLSEEGVARLGPDVILDLAPKKDSTEAEAAVRAWDSMRQVAAVRNKRVYALTGDYVVSPGPRFIITLEDAARAIHPELDWSVTP
jgi:iron complex transport system substrate-binding protein